MHWIRTKEDSFIILIHESEYHGAQTREVETEMGKFTFYGKLSEISEKDAKELVDVKPNEKTLIGNLDIPLSHVRKLYWIAEGLGIKEEDYDKYYVIKT